MDTHLLPFIHNIFIALIALFPVINPIGTAFVVNPFFTSLSREKRRTVVFKVAIYTFYLCAVTLFSGHWILQLFGLSVPVVKLAGGIMICKIGWDLLSDKSDSDASTSGEIAQGTQDISTKIFYPITFPMTAGAGTVSVLFTLSAHGGKQSILEYVLNMSSILIAIVLLCVMVFFMYLNTDSLMSRMGSKNSVVVNRVMAFLIFCVGLQIAYDGISAFALK